MSDEAVELKTGKTWAEWFKILDAAGAKKMTHQEIVAVLSKKHGVGPWWQQMVTVTYEQARANTRSSLRTNHEPEAESHGPASGLVAFNESSNLRTARRA